MIIVGRLNDIYHYLFGILSFTLINERLPLFPHRTGPIKKYIIQNWLYPKSRCRAATLELKVTINPVKRKLTFLVFKASLKQRCRGWSGGNA